MTKCKYESCKKRAYFGIKGQKSEYCSSHKLEDMIDIKNKRCLHKDCNKISSYNLPGKKHAIYCVSHKSEGMVDVKSKRCKTPLCDVSANKKYKGYCLRCFIHTFPDEKVSRNYKTKEKYVSDFIESTFDNYKWVCDKHVDGGCSKRRPDLLLDIGPQVLIVEIDENQHQDYDCSCENKRLMEISVDLGNKPIVFIRFNPDDYIKGNDKITSCWGNNTSGICVIKKTKIKEWEDRLKVLSDTVTYWIENNTDKTLEIVQLFYDQ
jgi:hypothetical protein